MIDFELFVRLPSGSQPSSKIASCQSAIRNLISQIKMYNLALSLKVKEGDIVAEGTDKAEWDDMALF